ncbi:MFS transporter [Sporolactobacillus shoreae]|uniref:MFS transporter n=1 Tax=Sporolactobacillus shoreae TaxID=1465501 RepID=A0A4Z0GTS2_9BACL|nr:MFS transporter [Sporolactobacillus shoreae]TGB00155.1 MFS transporter [Sporolactobacillus shoreae]
MTLNFWKLLSGRVASNIGQCFYNVSLVWLIYHITRNTFYTGLTGFLVLMPMILQFLVGPLIEKFEKKKLLIATEAGQIFTVVIAFTLYSTVWHSVWALIFLTPVVAILSMFSNPAEMTLIPEFVEEGKYATANSLMNVTYQTLTIIFTSLVGVLLIYVNPLTLYVTSIVFNAAAILPFFFMHLSKNRKVADDPVRRAIRPLIAEYVHSLTGGIRNFHRSFILKFLPATIIANCVFGMLSAVLPAYAMMRGGSQWFGIYQSAETLGILMGASLAPIIQKFPLGKITIYGGIVGSVCWLLSFFSVNNYWSVLFYTVSLLFIGVTNILFVSGLQKAVPKEDLAQFFTIMTSFGGFGMPLGSLAGGQIAQLWGIVPIFISVGLSFLFISIYWLSQKILRQMPAVDKLGSGIYMVYTDSHSE